MLLVAPILRVRLYVLPSSCQESEVVNAEVQVTRFLFSWSLTAPSRQAIYNLHGLSYQEKVSRFSMRPIPYNGTCLSVSQWKLRMVLMVGYRSSRLNQNKPFSGSLSTLLSSSAELYSFTLSCHLHAVGLTALTWCGFLSSTYCNDILFLIYIYIYVA